MKSCQRSIPCRFHQQIKLKISTLNWSSFWQTLLILFLQNLRENVGEIDPNCQLHQHFTNKFFLRKQIEQLISFYVLTYARFRRKKHFHTKNMHVKRWFNWPQIYFFNVWPNFRRNIALLSLSSIARTQDVLLQISNFSPSGHKVFPLFLSLENWKMCVCEFERESGSLCV